MEIFKELSKIAERPDVKEALEARVFIADKIQATLDECFKLIGEKPVKFTGRLHDIIVEDFRKELAEIQSPVVRHLFILAKAKQLNHLRVGRIHRFDRDGGRDRPFRCRRAAGELSPR
jgi:hypothetical protein